MPPQPESAASAEQTAGPPAQADQTGSIAAAVERILLATDPVVAAVASKVEQKTRQIAGEVELNLARETLERREQLVQLRRELTASATALADRFEELFDRLDQAEATLTGASGEPGKTGRPAPGAVRERRRVTIAYEDVPGWLREEKAAEPIQPKPVQGQQVPIPFAGRRPRRRWWRLWQGEAA